MSLSWDRITSISEGLRRFLFVDNWETEGDTETS